MIILVIQQGAYRNLLERIEKEVNYFDIEKINSALEKLLFSDPLFYSEITNNPYRDVIQVFPESEKLQRLFEERNSIILPPSVEHLLSRISVDTDKLLNRVGFATNKKDFYAIIAKQLFFFRPQIVIVTAPYLVNYELLLGLREILKFKLIGYINPAAMDPGFLPKFKNYRIFDFIYSPFLPAVIMARSHCRVPAELIPLFFIYRPVAVEKMLKTEKRYDITFSGSFHYVHRGRLHLMEEIAKAFPKNFHIFTQSYYALPPNLKEFYRGEAMALDNLSVISQSKIVINNHGDILPWAHNIRLYETTGMGTFLLTDNLPGLSDLFEIGKECEAYYDLKHCVRLIEKYLMDEEKREEIAKAGQQKTLNYHTAKHRAKLFAESLKKFGIIRN